MLWRILIAAAICILVAFIFRMFSSGRNGGASDSRPQASDKPAEGDQDYISLKKALADGGVNYDIKLILNLTDEGEYAKTYSLIVPGKDAVDIWKQLRSLVSATGRWPLIMGHEFLDSDQFMLIDESEISTRDVLKRVENVDLDKWMGKTASSAGNRYNFPSGEWPKLEEGTNELWERRISVHKDILTDEPHGSVMIGLLPVSEGWQAPAALKWGNWNECPAPEVHCAALKRWSDKYGAELVSMTEDVLEVRVARLPANRDEAMELARFQYVYCPDSVEQGLGSLEVLAAHIMTDPVWFFWWD